MWCLCLQCVVCLSAAATMQTFPCAHRVTCRRCFVRTIQTAISDRNLPLRCVVCRARILTLNEPASQATQTSPAHTAAPSTSEDPYSNLHAVDQWTPTKHFDADVDPRELSVGSMMKKQSTDDADTTFVTGKYV